MFTRAKDGGSFRMMRTMLAVSLMLIGLGMGNMLFAGYKYEQYLNVLSTASALRTSPSLTEEPPLGPLPDFGKDAQHYRRVQVRLDFYSFVIQGGHVLVGAGIAVLLVAALVRLGFLGNEHQG